MFRKILLLASMITLVFSLLTMTSRFFARLLNAHGSQLVFPGENNYLYMFDLQTHHLLQISRHLDGTVLQGSVNWLDDGQHISFILFDQPVDSSSFGGDLYKLDVRSKVLTSLKIGKDIIKREVVWSDDSIIFTDGLGENIYLSDYDGNLRRLTTTTAGYFGLDLSGQTLAFSILDPDRAGAQLALMDIETAEITRLDVFSQNSMRPVWSPDGKRLAFDLIVDNDRAIFSYDIETRELKRLSLPTQNVAFPIWSPDGEKLLFTSLGSSVSSFSLNVGMMNADGSNVKFFPSANASNYQPSWSPDGRWIAFFSDRQKTHYNVYLQPVYNLQAPPLRINTVNPLYSSLWR